MTGRQPFTLKCMIDDDQRHVISRLKFDRLIAICHFGHQLKYSSSYNTATAPDQELQKGEVPWWDGRSESPEADEFLQLKSENVASPG
ncbi:hypothetical protein PoB_001438700 [Plakobranchus ocellatus]|uniref:Uncharacterized protein n=1 Tax=Plakobranchus ocellatus TaxID=259542 RepID=A0AAV3Z019_9GAST|nr:hypothetical protein PoB_001438700 [Plakobranchus ocellatus]